MGLDDRLHQFQLAVEVVHLLFVAILTWFRNRASCRSDTIATAIMILEVYRVYYWCRN